MLYSPTEPKYTAVMLTRHFAIGSVLFLLAACDGGDSDQQDLAPSMFKDFSVNTISASIQKSGEQWLWTLSLSDVTNACDAAATPSRAPAPNSREILFQFAQEGQFSANTIRAGAFVAGCPDGDGTAQEFSDGCAYYREWGQSGELSYWEASRFGGKHSPKHLTAALARASGH